MSAPPDLFDDHLLTLRRNRARTIRPAADFLHRDLAAMVQERLTEVNKAFTERLVVTSCPEIWSQALQAGAIADRPVLDIAPAGADLIVHALCLHWSKDPVGQLVQMRRGLRPDGMMLACLFAGQTLHELRQSLAEAEIETLGGLSPRVAPMGEIRDLGALVSRAGLALPVADSVTLTVTYPHPLALMHDLRAMGETNMMRARSRLPMRRRMLERTITLYQSRFGLPDGRVPATFEIVFLTGWAPAPGQQQPLRPGSAQSRLADALGTSEKPLR